MGEWGAWALLESKTGFGYDLKSACTILNQIPENEDTVGCLKAGGLFTTD